MINIEDVSNYTSLHMHTVAWSCNGKYDGQNIRRNFRDHFQKKNLKDLGKMRAWEKMNKLVARQKLSSNVGRK